MTTHGRATHIGLCQRAAQLPPPAPPRGQPGVPPPALPLQNLLAPLIVAHGVHGVHNDGHAAHGFDEGDEAEEERLFDHDDQEHPAPRANPFQSLADLRLAELYVQNDGLSSAMVNRFLKVVEGGALPTFQSAACLTQQIDTLPGPEFTIHPIVVPESEAPPYTLYARDLVSATAHAVRKYAHCLEIPELRDPTDDSPVKELWEAERYQQLLREFREGGAPATAILLPLSFHSDETCLTLFNSNSDQASAYPLFLSLGLVPRSERLRPASLTTLALLPKFLKRFDEDKGSAKLAHLKRQLTWKCFECVLAPLLELDPFDEEIDVRYRFAKEG